MAGRAGFHGATTAEVENTGKSDVEALMVEIRKDSYTAAPAGADPLRAAAKVFTKALADEHGRVLVALAAFSCSTCP